VQGIGGWMGFKIAAGLIALSLLAGCGAGAASGNTAAQTVQAQNASDSDDESGGGSVVLTPEQANALGIVTTPAQAVTFAPAATGLGVVLGHEPFAQMAADLATAVAAARQSRTALTRIQHLTGGPGALGADALESATKQRSADDAALALARRKVTATLGPQFPVRGSDADSVLAAVADGATKVARITFPPGALSGALPTRLRLFSLDEGTSGAAWTADTIWEAPRDPTLPGRSVFALLTKTDIPEGARVQASPMAHSGTPGVLIPDAAVVISNGRYWCYIRKSTTTFARIAVDIARPLAAGYFVPADGLAPGEPIVTAGAGLLLARQTNRASGPAD